MMSYIISGMILMAIVTGAAGGRMAEVSTAAMTGCGDAVQLAISLAGTLCLWSGVMRVAEKSGLTQGLCRLFRPVTARIFRELSSTGPAMAAIAMNIAANLLGLGNAATPLGIAAMKELEKEGGGGAVASRAMVTFVVLNTASIQLIPTTTAFLRLNAGSKNPMEILPAVWLTSAVTVTVGVSIAQCWGRRRERHVLRR